MARKIFVSSDMSVDEALMAISEHTPLAPLLWPWLLTAFDDWGRSEASPLRIKAKVFPMFAAVTVQGITDAISCFSEHGLVEIYTDIKTQKPMMRCPNWLELQYDGRLPPCSWREIRSKIFMRDDYTCAYCGQRGGELHCDHIVPVSKNGSNDEDNLVTSCRSCNLSKAAKSIEEWKK